MGAEGFLFLSLLAVIFVVAKLRERAGEDVWGDAAVLLDLERVHRSRRLAMRGVRDGVELVVTAGRHGQLAGTTVVASGTPPIPDELRILKAETWLPEQAPDEQVGDAAFDHAFRLHGPTDVVAAALTERARSLLGWLLVGGHVEVSHGRIEARLDARIGARVDRTQALVSAVKQVAELHRELSLAGEGVAKRLADNAAIDTSAKVRRLNLRLLLQHHRDSADAKRAAGSAGFEGLLMDLLEDREHRLWALGELAEVGTVRALPRVRAIGGGMLVDATFRSAVERTLAAIEARLPAADAGDLSLVSADADARDGELSVVEDRSGELSIGDDDG